MSVVTLLRLVQAEQAASAGQVVQVLVTTVQTAETRLSAHSEPPPAAVVVPVQTHLLEATVVRVAVAHTMHRALRVPELWVKDSQEVRTVTILVHYRVHLLHPAVVAPVRLVEAVRAQVVEPEELVSRTQSRVPVSTTEAVAVDQSSTYQLLRYQQGQEGSVAVVPVR